MNEEVWPADTSQRVAEMIEHIDDALMRVLESKPYGTRIKLSDDEWLINDRARII